MVRQPQGGLGRSVLTKQVTPLCRDPPNNLSRVAVVRQPQGGLGRGVLRYISPNPTPRMMYHSGPPPRMVCHSGPR